MKGCWGVQRAQASYSDVDQTESAMPSPTTLPLKMHASPSYSLHAASFHALHIGRFRPEDGAMQR